MEYDLKEILTNDNEFKFKPKQEYKELFGDILNRDVLVKSIDTSISWHTFKIGDKYAGMYGYIGLKDNKIYFLNISYGYDSSSDVLLAVEDDIQGLIELQNSIKNSIMEFESFDELIDCIRNCGGVWWQTEKHKIINFIRNEVMRDC